MGGRRPRGEEREAGTETHRRELPPWPRLLRLQTGVLTAPGKSVRGMERQRMLSGPVQCLRAGGMK